MDKELIELLHSMTGDYSEQAWQHEVILKAITTLEAAERTIAAYRKNYNAEEKENEELQQRIEELEAEKPDAAEIIELRKACAIYQTNGIANRARIEELEVKLATRIPQLILKNERLDAALAQAIATANLDREAGFHSEYCPHGAEWGQCTLCPARAGK